MDSRSKIVESAQALANAISRRSADGIREILTEDFLLRTPGKDAIGVEAFVESVQNIPGEILFVRLEDIEIDWTPAGAAVTGIQRSQLRIDDNLVDDVRPFVDLFIESKTGQWRLQWAVNLPSA